MKSTTNFSNSWLKTSIGLLAGVSLIAISDQRSASALIVAVPGYGTWNIQVKYQAAINLDPPVSSMPWWGNQAAANDFATATGSGLGMVYSNLGPFFAWDYLFVHIPFEEPLLYMDAFCIGAPCFGRFGSADTAYSFGPNYPAGHFGQEISYPWATATAVPGPLPILGAAAALGYSRKLRKRINRSKSYPVVSAID